MRSNGMFHCDHIKDTEQIHKVLNSFHVEPQETGMGLETYLKEWAMEEENMNFARTYLVMDCSTGELAGYFSLKTGSVTANEDALGNFDTIPGIELANFAVNASYRELHEGYKGLGAMIFMDFIMPIVKEVAEMVGVHILFVYALPYDELIDYYNGLAFMRLPEEQENILHNRIKPRYDAECIFMYQTV